MMKYHLKNMLP